MDKANMYGFTRCNFEDNSYPVPVKYENDTLSNKLLDKKKSFLIWKFFYNLDIKCRSDPYISSNSYITMICTTPEKGLGHWFNFGYYIDPMGESYYFYACIQSDTFERFDTLVSFTEYFLSDGCNILSLNVILKTPRTKKIARQMTPKSYSNIPVEVQFNTEGGLQLPNHRRFDNADRGGVVSDSEEGTPLDEYYTHDLEEYFRGLKFVIYISKDHTWKQVIKIIERHPDTLKFKIAKISYSRDNTVDFTLVKNIKKKN